MDQLSRPTRSRVRVDTGSACSPEPFGPRSELTRFRSAGPANSDPGPRRCGVDQLSWPTRPGFELTRARPAILADSVPVPI